MTHTGSISALAESGEQSTQPAPPGLPRRDLDDLRSLTPPTGWRPQTDPRSPTPPSLFLCLILFIYSYIFFLSSPPAPPLSILSRLQGDHRPEAKMHRLSHGDVGLGAASCRHHRSGSGGQVSRKIRHRKNAEQPPKALVARGDRTHEEKRNSVGGRKSALDGF